VPFIFVPLSPSPTAPSALGYSSLRAAADKFLFVPPLDLVLLPADRDQINTPGASFHPKYLHMFIIWLTEVCRFILSISYPVKTVQELNF
jgi:hypothetical protein